MNLVCIVLLDDYGLFVMGAVALHGVACTVVCPASHHLFTLYKVTHTVLLRLLLPYLPGDPSTDFLHPSEFV